jgi:arylsulfatase A-like enzyme
MVLPSGANVPEENQLNTYPQGEAFTGVTADTAAESTPAWPIRKYPPAGAPNVAMVVLDDTGFAQLGCFGGLGGRVDTPNIDRIAARGIRYQNFHTTALCSPSRAALLTGRNHHSAGVATIMERATGYPGYNGRIPKDCAMLPEVLRQNGYNTMAVGKWHLAPDEETTPVGPYDRWPLGQGFERFYGFLPGETSQWEPDLWMDNHRVDPPGRPADGYHLTTDLVDTAIDWIGERHAVAPSKPFFLYLALGAMHSPHHAPTEYIERCRGAFDDGWDAVRAETLARQKELGIMPEGVVLSDRNPGIAAWETLPEDEQRLYARQMEVFAGFLAHTDEQLGRFFDFLDQSGIGDDTLLVVLSDNGASAEGGQNGLLNELSYFNGEPESVGEMLEHLDEWGGPTTHPHFAAGWAMAGNTPNRYYKAFVHEGGTRDPMIVVWPGRIDDPGAIRTQFHHVVDLTPTILDVVGIEWPDNVNGHKQRPLEGTSFAYTFEHPEAPTPKEKQYFEMFAHRAIWADGWKAVTLHWSKAVLQRLGHIDHQLNDGDWDADQWELYHLDTDPAETNDLGTEQPEKLRELIDLWWKEARRYQVLPLDDTLLERLMTKRPQEFEQRESYVYNGRFKLSRPASPETRDRSYTIEVEVEIPEEGAEGVIVSNGGLDGGYTLCVLDGKVHFVSNFLGRHRDTVSSAVRIAPGRHLIVVHFERTAPHAGRAELIVDAESHGFVDIEKTNPVAYASAEGLEIGSDSTSAVWDRYEPPFEFTGIINQVKISTGSPGEASDKDLLARDRAEMLRQ